MCEGGFERARAWQGRRAESIIGGITVEPLDAAAKHPKPTTARRIAHRVANPHACGGGR